MPTRAPFAGGVAGATVPLAICPSFSSPPFIIVAPADPPRRLQGFPFPILPVASDLHRHSGSAAGGCGDTTLPFLMRPPPCFFAPSPSAPRLPRVPRGVTPASSPTRLPAEDSKYDRFSALSASAVEPRGVELTPRVMAATLLTIGRGSDKDVHARPCGDGKHSLVTRASAIDGRRPLLVILGRSGEVALSACCRLAAAASHEAGTRP